MAHDPIITVTLNPALDFAADVPELIPNEKLRCATPSMFPGGGGVNVARAIWNLGGNAKACVALGGPNGQALDLLLRAEGVSVLPVPLDVQTRHSLSVRDESTGELFRFMLPGTPWTQMIEANFLAAVSSHLGGVKYCILSGSMPPGTGIETIRSMATICHNAGCKIIVDTSGPTLKNLVQQAAIGVDILRVNEEEAQASTQETLVTIEDYANAAREIIKRGSANQVIVGLGGGKGNLMVENGGEAFIVPAPKITVISRVGAGDSFVAGMTLTLARGETAKQALLMGAASASNACLQPGTQLCQRDATEALAKKLTVETLG